MSASEYLSKGSRLYLYGGRVCVYQYRYVDTIRGCSQTNKICAIE